MGGKNVITRICVAIAIFFLTGPAFAWDAAECQDTADRLSRAARDAEDAAESFLSSPNRSALDLVHSELLEVEDRLHRANSACGVVPPRSIGAARAMMTDTQALAEIEAWENLMNVKDRRFAEVKPRILSLLEQVIRSMPPQYWKSTMELMYQAAR